MSEQKITFQAPVAGDFSSPRQPVAAPPSNVQTVRSRGGPQPGGGAGQGISAQFVLHVLRRWWKIALPAGLVLAIVAVATTYWLFEPQYEAAALLEIHEQPQYIAFEPKEGALPRGISARRWKSSAADGSLAAPSPTRRSNNCPRSASLEDPIDWLRKRVNVIAANDSDLFEIKYASPDPENAALVVNEVTQQYLTAEEEEESKRSRDIIAALTEEMKSREQSVRTLRTQVQTATQQVSGKEPELAGQDPNSSVKNPLGELQGRLVAVQVERAMLSARIKASEEETLRGGEEWRRLRATRRRKWGRRRHPGKRGKRLRCARAWCARPSQRTRRSSSGNRNWRPCERRLQVIEMRARGGKEDPLYLKAQKEIAIFEQNLEELKRKLSGPIRADVELSAAEQRQRGTELWRSTGDMRNWRGFATRCGAMKSPKKTCGRHIPAS